jgi:signal transduction histidine kinase
MREPGAVLERVHWVGGCLVRVMAAGMGGFFLLVCLLHIRPHYALIDLWTIGVAAVVMVATLPSRFTAGWTVLAVSLSAATTALLALHPEGVRQPSVLVEATALLVLTVRVVWRTGRDRVVPATALVAGTAIARVSVLALASVAPPLALLVVAAPMAVLVAVAIGIGLYLRALDARRARAVLEARRDERLELARDLHDFVAHHITGIVVQAQAARFAAQSGAAQTPEQLDATFAGIEKAGTEALTSMRRMVSLLRDAQHTDRAAQDAGADRAAAGADGPAGRDRGAAGRPGRGGSATRPIADLSQVEELVAGFTDLPVTLTVDPGLGDLPPEIATSVHRIVQEALTNTRKHAADATRVRVEVVRVPDGIEVGVRDNGQGRGRRLPSSGFGLVGLAERVEALGGRMRAGRRPEGGWELVAVLPYARVLRESNA